MISSPTNAPRALPLRWDRKFINRRSMGQCRGLKKNRKFVNRSIYWWSVLFVVILERTDGNIGSDRISSQTSTNFLKNLIFCYEILSKANAFSRMTAKKGKSAIDTNYIKFFVFYLKTKILQSLPLLYVKNLLNTSTMGKVSTDVNIGGRKRYAP